MKTNILIKIPPFLNFHCEVIFWSKLSRASNNWIMIIYSALFNHLSVFSVSTFSFLRLFSSESIPFQGHFTKILWESICPPGILLPFFYQAHLTCPLGNCDSPLLQDPIYPQIPEQHPSLPALHPTNSLLHQASTWPQMQKGAMILRDSPGPPSPSQSDWHWEGHFYWALLRRCWESVCMPDQLGATAVRRWFLSCQHYLPICRQRERERKTEGERNPVCHPSPWIFQSLTFKIW